MAWGSAIPVQKWLAAWAWRFGGALAIVGVGFASVAPRYADAPDAASRIRGDALYYFAMAEDGTDVIAPFRYRVAVPAMVRLLSLDTSDAFRLINMAALFLCVVLLLWTFERLNLTRWASAAGVVCIFACQPALHIFHNPFITDGPGWLTVHAAAVAIWLSSFWPFFFAIVVGVVVREAALFAAPAWAAVSRDGRLVAVALAAVAVLAGIRFWVDGSFAGFSEQAGQRSARTFSRIAGDALAAWHVLWFLAASGILLLERPLRSRTAVLALVLLGGAALSSVFATDTTRMFGILAPVVALGVARHLQALREVSRSLAWAVLCAISAAAVVWQPMRFLPGSRTGVDWRPVRALAFVTLAVLAVLAVAVVRRAQRRCAVISPPGG